MPLTVVKTIEHQAVCFPYLYFKGCKGPRPLFPIFSELLQICPQLIIQFCGVWSPHKNQTVQ
ncbi:hypothetical protein PROFUN_09727 [Planoprotostelium fungivorum]|uniref:Uncharacterized protein n=1 Tax=Planoprotostelium fungivorum TaxID=1890364 RepID=A0A2P6NEU0_9EUKA|nr:hypothetical protein PROFUN_09727 [Planoprotostelium fungivorum]